MKLCVRCGVSPLRHPRAKYCHPCSALADADRKLAYSKTHPPRRYPETRARRTLELRASGLLRSRDTAETISFSRQEAELVRVVRLALPYDRNYSKNAIYTMGIGGHVHLRQRQRELREAIVWRLKGERWPCRKTYLDILVEKPDHKSDAVNVLDCLCDAIKVGIGVDDRWFTVLSLDWRIVKGAGRILISIGQDGTTDQAACSYCGGIFDLSQFTKNRTAKSGVSRRCRGCSRLSR